MTKKHKPVIKLTKQQELIRALSERMVKAQQPIRVLDAIKWGPEVQHNFFKHHCKKLPNVTREYYEKNPLPYDPEKKTEEFYAIERDIRSQLGELSSVGKIMQRICREYRGVLRMLQVRGTREFSCIAQELYGSSRDAFYAGAPTLKDLAKTVSETLAAFSGQFVTEADEKRYNSEETVEILNERLSRYFHDRDKQRFAKISDGILADSAAGAESIKIRKGAYFSEREIRAFEVHEGWVHLGTTLNGMAQPICTFLSKGAPSSTQTQEGLATLMEIFTFTSYPGRIQRITDRITAISMAEEGGNFLDVFHFYLERGLTEEAAYLSTTRAFRGSLPNAGPFTKDLGYTKGFISIFNYIRIAIIMGSLPQIPMLFVGKTTLEDIKILSDLVGEGLVVPPKYVPPQFNDLAALSAWMAYSLFMQKLDLRMLAADYKHILDD